MKNRRVISLGLVTVLASSILGGCDFKSDTPVLGTLFGLKGDQIFQIDELMCTTPEVKLLMLNKANKYRIDFGGSVDWNQKISDTTLGEFVKDETKNDISITYTMAALADKNNMEIDEVDKNAISTAAKEYYSSLTEEEKEYTGATESTVETLYTNYYKANKIYDFLTSDVNFEISDEEARVMEVQYIYIDTSKTDATKAQSQLEDVIDLVKGGYQSFSREAKQYSDDDLITATLKKNEASQAYETAAFELTDGEMSPIITQDNGLYLVYCEKSYLKEETEKNKQQIIESSKNSYFSEIYNEYKDNASSDFNTDAWNKIKLPEGENMTTTNILDLFNAINTEEETTAGQE